MKKHLYLLVLLAAVLFSCKPKVELEKPEVVTFPVSEITESSAVCGGNVVSDGGAEVTSRGVCWSVNQNPTIDDSRTNDGNGIGSFISNITELDDSTTYYVRAYAINSEGVSYGSEKSFVTYGIGNDDDGSGNGNGDEDGDGDEVIVELPSVVTVDITEITETSAICGGEVTSDGGAEITARGVCWSVNQNPTLEDSFTSDGNGVGSFTSNLQNLDPNTQYYIRAYATNEMGTSYGDEMSFTTLEMIEDEEGTINGHRYVDLGLPSGLLWAECNLGASTPTEYGDYYAWGETVTKEIYTDETCSTHDVEMPEDIAGISEYDAARANWGSTWKMPSKKDFEELLTECDWEWVEIDGVKGSKVTGPNGNYIFLPAAGFRQDTNLLLDNVFGYFWCSSNYIHELDFYAYSLSVFDGFNEVNWDDRAIGNSVRAVSEMIVE